MNIKSFLYELLLIKGLYTMDPFRVFTAIEVICSIFDPELVQSDQLQGVFV